MEGARQPAISIVVCAFNEDARTEQCLRSLFGQDLDATCYEIIFVDDGSTAETPSIARRCLSENVDSPRPRALYIRIEHGGLCAARNTGIAHSRAPVIAFIDADAVAEPDWVRRIAVSFEVDPQVGVVGGRTRILNPENVTARRLHAWHYDGTDKVDVIGCNMALRRTLLDAVGGFRTCFESRGDETELVSRLRGRCKIKKVPHAIVYHERPRSLVGWLRERGSNGRFYAWLERLARTERPETYRERPWKGAIKRLVTLSPPLCLLGMILEPWIGLLSVPGALQVVRRQAGERTVHMLRESRHMVGSVTGAMWGAMGFCMNILGDACSDVGYLRGVLERPGPFTQAATVTVTSAKVEDMLEVEGSGEKGEALELV